MTRTTAWMFAALTLAAAACGGKSGGDPGTGGIGGSGGRGGRGGVGGQAGTGGTGGMGGDAGMGGTGAGGTGGMAGSGAGGSGPLPDVLTARDAVNVFLSGHSLINLDMPWNLNQLAMANGHTHYYNLQMGIGASMAARVTSSGTEQDAAGDRRTFNVLAEIRNAMTLPGGRKYDTLVITEASEIASNVLYSNTVAHARTFYDALIMGNANGRVFLYDSWDDSNGAIAAWVTKTRADHIWYECVASAVNKDPARQRNPMLLIPAGMMMASLAEAITARQIPGLTDPAAILHPDGHHASDLGNYLLAISTYGALYGRMPELTGVSPTNRFARAYSLPSADALNGARNHIWQTLTRFYQSGHNNRRTMADCRQRLAMNCGAVPASPCRAEVNRIFAD